LFSFVHTWLHILEVDQRIPLRYYGIIVSKEFVGEAPVKLEEILPSESSTMAIFEDCSLICIEDKYDCFV